jgi:hypothetical protein
MAGDAVVFHERIRVCFGIDRLSGIEMIQEIIAFALLAAAVFFLARKFFWKKKKKGCGGPDCGCH